MFQIIPLTSDPNQEFQVILQINDVNVAFKFNVRWNATAGYWVITITNMNTGEYVLDSIPLVVGEQVASNILHVYDHMRIGSAFLIKVMSSSKSDSPNDTNLGTDFLLVWDDNL